MPFRSIATALFLAVPLAVSGRAAVADTLTGVPNANPKAPGVTVPSVLSPELAQVARVQGSTPVENPNDFVKYYGYLNDQPNLLPGLGSNVEATKTEPDKNTYLVLYDLKGADPDYDYGRHFLFQGHELGSPGSITRVNLDADAAHRVTVLANFEKNGTTRLPVFDGSTWYPWAERLLFSQEGNGSTSGGIWQATPDYPSSVENLLGVLGHGGYEGMQADSDGNVWILEDIGGSVPGGEVNAKAPNSFLYRFTPKNPRDLLQGGKLKALQVVSLRSGLPIVFQTASALTDDILDLHTYGLEFRTRWVTVHDTDVDGFAPFAANLLAKARNATPFKRPENGLFRPGRRFQEFFFDETGDTSNTSAANAHHGGWGSVLKLVQSSPSASNGRLSLLFKGDRAHAAFDNCAFWDEDHIVFVEDRGDGLHTDANALDSGWLFDVDTDYSDPVRQPVRIIAQGRDPSATVDSGLSGTTGFQNEGDNEITGIHVSDGDPSERGLLGAKRPEPFEDGWRVFYTGQHGDNVTYEIIRAPRHGKHDDDEDDKQGFGDRR
jgi:hypothetical protein